MEEQIQIYWNNALTELGLHPEKSKQCFESVMSNYKGSNRHYHTIRHIGIMLGELSQFRLTSHDEAIVVLSIIFHDVIYNPILKNNEEKSAVFATSVLQELGLSKQIINEISRLILLTKKHECEPNDKLGNILLDLDLSILSTPSLLYKWYTESIRKEYFMYPDFIYKPGRKKVIQSFLKRERIFKTKEFHLAEKTARMNLQNEAYPNHIAIWEF
jgi:predicted metal-dependent HD superfamily phosphohydrolase